MRRDNILILSVSRKTLLCRWFLAAARKYNLGVLGADLNPSASALSVLDGTISLPELKDPSFIDILLSTVKKNRIKLIVPTSDEELLFLPEFIELLQSFGCSVLCNSIEIAKRMIDKHEFFRFCTAVLGFSNLRVISNPKDARDEDFPLFFRGGGVKASLKMRVENKAELEASFLLTGGGVATTFLEGKEISVDCYISREGRVIYNVPRTRDIILGGESIVTTTIDSPICCEVSERLLSLSRIRGPVVLQGMLSEECFVPFEINLRFGGASSLSFKAAYSGPELAIREYVIGERLKDTFQYKVGLELFKDFREVYLPR